MNNRLKAIRRELPDRIPDQDDNMPHGFMYLRYVKPRGSMKVPNQDETKGQ